MNYLVKDHAAALLRIVELENRDNNDDSRP